MSGTVRLGDGTVGYYARRGDDCWPAAAATVLQVSLVELPDLCLDQRLAAGMSFEEVDAAAKGDVGRWLAGRKLRLVEHRRPPVHLPRWLGVVPMDGWFVSHCLCMAYGAVLHDPTRPVSELDLALVQMGTPLRLANRLWRADDVLEEFSFASLYPTRGR